MDNEVIEVEILAFPLDYGEFDISNLTIKTFRDGGRTKITYSVSDKNQLNLSNILKQCLSFKKHRGGILVVLDMHCVVLEMLVNNKTYEVDDYIFIDGFINE